MEKNPTEEYQIVPMTSDTFASQDHISANFKSIGAVVHWNQTPSFNDISALLDPSQEVLPGQFLGVWHGRRGIKVLTVIQVVNSYEINPNENPELAAARNALGLEKGYGGEGVSTRIFRLAECSTVEEFDLKDKDGICEIVSDGRSPMTLSRAGDPVVLLPPEITGQAIGTLPNPDQGVYLGKTFGTGGEVQVTLTPQIFQLHIGVFGNPGKGKSYLSGNLIEEARSWDIPTLVLDINGESVEQAKAMNGLVITLPDPKFGISLNLMTPPELVAITPNVQPNTIYAELIELAHDQLRNERQGKRITFEELRQRIANLGQASKATPSSLGIAISRLSMLEKDPIIGGNFDFIKQIQDHRLVVLDCRYLSLRQIQLIAAAGARELQRIGREMARKAEEGDKEAQKWFALYFVDEAHAVIPNDDQVISTQVHLELARMGRHVRTGLVLSSQSPQDLNPSVLKRVQTRFIFALEKDQLHSIQGVMSDLDEKIVRQLPKLPRGICAVSGSGELVRHGFLLKVRERVTPVGGRTPGVFKGCTKTVIKGK